MPAASRFNNAVRYRAGDDPAQTVLTPAYLIGPIRELLGGIDLDPCTTPDNPTRALRFFTAEMNGLAHDWLVDFDDVYDPSIFVNPPYGKARRPWVDRCVAAGDQGARVVLLIPSATDTAIWQQAAKTASSIFFTQGRVKSDGEKRPNGRRRAWSHPSTVFGWHADLKPLEDVVVDGHPLGICVK